MNDDKTDRDPGFPSPDLSTPNSPTPGDEDIRISNTGQRVRAIAVALIVAVGAAAALVWYSNEQSERKRHEDTKRKIEAAHAKGYVNFWKTAQIDIAGMKTNMEFESRISQIISDDPVRYAKFLREKCLPIIEASLHLYDKIEAPLAYGDKMGALAKAARDLSEEWHIFADSLLMFKGFIEGKKKLDETANAWLGAQQSKDVKFQNKAYRYFKLLECIMPDNAMKDIQIQELNAQVQGTCETEQPKWFERVAFECLPALTRNPGTPDEGFAAAIAAARKSPKTDFNSKFAIEDCLKSSKPTFEEELIAPLLKTWVAYLKAQNELIQAIKTEMDKR